MTNEPVVSLVLGLIAATAGLLTAFGVDLTPEQIAALGTFAGAALGVAFFVRAKVTPTGKLGGERGQAEPLTLLIYAIVAVILVVLLLKVLDRV